MKPEQSSLNSVKGLFILNQSVHWAMIGVLFPVLSLAILEKGVDYFQLGILMASYSAATVLLELPTGGLADSIGRKTVYIFSLLAGAIGLVIFYFAQTLPFICVAFILMGTGRALSSGSIESHFIDRFYEINPKVDLQKIMSVVYAVVPIALGIASLAGGMLPDFTESLGSFPLIRDQYSLNILLSLCLYLLQIILTSILVRETPREGKRGGFLQGFRDVPKVVSTSVAFGLKNPSVLLLLIGGFIWGFSISGLEQYWQPRLEGIGGEGLPSSAFGAISAGYFAASALGSILAGQVSKIFRKKYKWMLMVSRIAMGGFFLLLIQRNSVGGFAVFYFATFMFNGLANSPESAVMNDQLPREKRSTVLSFASLFLQLGGLAGSLLLGYLAREISISFSWLVAASVLLASAFLYALIPGTKSE